ncbi:MAG: glycerophosphodiester phosphodiesterase [Deltaproteobacteria bacterium]|nr:glycerophosphodiester phosphodiesterase [Deltaproteobacteria bacterium]
MTKQKKIKLCLLGKSLFVPLVLLMVSSCFTSGKSGPTINVEQPAKNIYIIGHRGAAGLAPENTLSAFKRACSIGVDAVELDVLLTADNKIVVHHDYSLKPEITRTPQGDWLSLPGPAIKDLTLAELKTYDVGRLKPNTRYSHRYPEQQPADGERIPTLGEVITLFKTKYDVAAQLWIEIKTNPEKPNLTPTPKTVADAVVQFLRQQDFAGRVRILSFDWRALVYIQKIAPDIPTVYVSLVGRSLNNIKPGQPGASPWMAGIDIDDFSGSVPRAVKAAGGRYWAPYYKHITYNLLKEAHELGLQVFVWTPDKRNAMVRLIEMGVDGIITNRPDILKALLSE